MATVYDINKGINRSIEFKGIKAQYITYLVIGLVLILLLFGVMFAVGLNTYVCIAVVVPLAGALVATIQHMSRKHGEHGLAKRIAAGRLPASLQCRSRDQFLSLKSSKYAR